MSINLRPLTKKVLDFYSFFDDSGEKTTWTPGQQEIIDCIVHRCSPDGLRRVQILASTRYGKSFAVAAGILARLVTEPEKWAIVAGTKDKARIIMEYLIMFALNSAVIRSELMVDTPLDRLRMRRSQDRLTFRRGGAVRVYSAEATRVNQTSKALMGFGAPNVVEDESSLIPDPLHALVMRMLGDSPDNFLMKIGNPFNRNHFLRSWNSPKYYKVFIDWRRAVEEGRTTQDFIDEMQEQPLFDPLYECKFPAADEPEDEGWMPLLTEEEIRRAFVPKTLGFAGELRMGGDVAGGGRNYSVLVLRGYNVARLVYKSQQKDTMLVATDFYSFLQSLSILSYNFFIDKVGLGRGAFDRVAQLREGVQGISGADEPADKLRFLNLRAEMYWRTREWVLGGGKLVENDDFLQLSKVLWRVIRTSGKIQMMSKEELLKRGVQSPDVADALSLTFSRSEAMPALRQQPLAPKPTMPKLNPYD